MFEEINNLKNIEEVFEVDGPISKFNENYKPRQAQIEAAKVIEEGLASPSNVLIEGETGMGKSYAYLFPIVKNLLESANKNGDIEKKAVIVTSGIALQEQLITKDIPFVIDVMRTMYPEMPRYFRGTLLKGKQNFICLKKLDELGLLDANDNMIDTNYKAIKEFAQTTEAGDLSELDFVPERDVLENVTCAKKGECLGRKCEYRDDCYYYQHKNLLSSSPIIVTNYHMFFSDLKIGGKILPPYEIAVFDEAHETAGIFRDFNSESLSYKSMFALRNKISELNNLSNEFMSRFPVEPLTEHVKDFEIVFAQIRSRLGDLSSPCMINTTKDIPYEDIMNLKGPISSLADKLYEVRNIESARIDDMKDDDMDPEYIKDREKILMVLDSAYEQSSDIVSFLDNLKQNIDNENVAVWAEEINETVYISCKYVEVGAMFNEKILSKEALTTIFTSATITVGGTFDYIKEQLGINLCSKPVHQMIGASPFDLTNQQLWYLPENALEGNKFGFDRLIPSQIEDIIRATKGGTLCLFTSVKNMRNTYNNLSWKLGGEYELLVQGDMPKMKLIEKFKSSNKSVLFGTKSFFTGVDIQGIALRSVIIDKFPFPQPTDPVQQVLKEKPNSFYKYSIPEMIILLKQAVGRGVRSVDDKCVITILDNRMATARYKTRINNSFGYRKTGTRNIEDVTKFTDKYIEEWGIEKFNSLMMENNKSNFDDFEGFDGPVDDGDMPF